MAGSNSNGQNGKKGQYPFTGDGLTSLKAGRYQPGVDEKLAALLSYLLGWITGIIFYLAGKSQFVKFHALQSIITFGAITVLQLVIRLARKVLTAFFQPPGAVYIVLNLYGIVSAVIWIGSLALWAFLMAKAYQGESYRLPIVGAIAVKQYNL